MSARRVLAALAACPFLMAAGPAPTPGPISDTSLQAAVQNDLPAIVDVIQNVSGALRESDGTMHGPYIGAFSGTGFFVSSDGYVVTAAHVAAPSDDEIKGELIDFYIDALYKCDPSTSSDQCQAVQDKHHAEVDAQMTMVNPHIDLRVLTQDMNPIDDGLAAKLVTSSPTVQQDNALLKVDAKNEPVMLLGDSVSVVTGTSLAVLGYPVSGQANGPTLVPTITTGQVVQKRRGDPGRFGGLGGTADLLQVNAHTEHGNSGGPAVLADGAVVGIVSFGDTLNHNYLIGSQDVSADLAQTPALKNQLGPIDTLYRQGLDAYGKGDYATARPIFEQCAALNPVQIYCHDLALDAARGGPAKDSAVAGDISLAWAERGGWTVLGGVLGALVVFLALRRRSGAGHPSTPAFGYPSAYAQPVYATAGYGGYGQQMPAYTPYGGAPGYPPMQPTPPPPAVPYLHPPQAPIEILSYATGQTVPRAAPPSHAHGGHRSALHIPAPSHPAYQPAQLAHLHADGPRVMSSAETGSDHFFDAVSFAFTQPPTTAAQAPMSFTTAAAPAPAVPRPAALAPMPL